MKKIFIYLVGLSLALSACKKAIDDNIDGKPTDERLSESLAAWQKKLTDAPNGWKMVVFPEGLVATDSIRSAFSYYMKFDNGGRVSMVADFDDKTASTVETSNYSLKAQQRPSLIFDTYGYINLPADPNKDKSKGPTGNQGRGWGSDFQFAFTENVSAAGDTIFLDGLLHHSRAYLVKASAAEQAAYTSAQFVNTMVLNKFISYFRRVSIGGKDQFDMTPAVGGKAIEIAYLDENKKPKVVVANYYYTPGSIHFMQALNINGKVIQSMDNLVFDQVTKNKATCTINGEQTVISGVGAPLISDPLAPDQFVTGKQLYGASSGFHMNGVDDAYGLASWKDSKGFPFFKYIIAVPQGIVTPLVYDDKTAAPVRPADDDGASYTFIAGNTNTVTILSYWPLFSNRTNPPAKTTLYFSNNSNFYPIKKADGKTWDIVSVSDTGVWMRLDYSE